MAWVALSLLFLNGINDFFRAHKRIFISLICILCAFFLIKQMKALNEDTNKLFANKITALAILFEVNDRDYLTRVYPNTELILRVSSNLKNLNLNLFALKENWVILKSVGDSSKLPIDKCDGTIDVIKRLPENLNFLRIEGSFIFQGKNTEIANLTFLDENINIQGIGYSKAQSPNQFYFVGYSKTDNPIKYIVVNSQNKSCTIKVNQNILIPNISIPLSSPLIREDLIGFKNITQSNNWIGSDFFKSKVDGFSISGSFITTDKDIADITLKMKKGQGLYYKTGPSSRFQKLTFLNLSYKTTILPQTNDWVFLKFDDSSLPNEFSIKISDEGTEFGEWSAIAILDN
jgi:hypothetical protein